MINSAKLAPENLRNVCILAHVDHGKTSVADSLLSLNGLVSKRSVGTAKFLDNRQDEQQRGITMKSSAVLLVDELTEEDDVDRNIPVILNLIDTPGHIDFSTEVTAAVRISDSAIIVVDVIEGVCAQTKDAIKHAFDERLAMLLVVNKIDKLVVDLKVNSTKMFYAILRAIEDCNAHIAHLNHLKLSSVDYEDQEVDGTVLEFSPELGNVVFASAVDGWGFTLEHIAKIYVDRIQNETEQSLTEKLWNFDCYVNTKTKKVQLGAIAKTKSNMFVQLVTSTFHFIYTSVVINGNLAEIGKLVEKFKIRTVPSYAQYGDSRSKLRVVLQAWRPLSRVLLKQCRMFLPSPVDLKRERFEYLVNKERYLLSPYMSQLADEVVEVLSKCSADEKVVAYLSKRIAIETTAVPQLDSDDLKNYEIVAIARVFSGRITCGQELYLLSSDYDPEQSISFDETVKKITVKGLYILSGRKYDKINSVTAGFICGIVGVDEVNWRTATLVDTLPMIPLIDRPTVEPILCNVITPLQQNHFSKLVQSLKLLEQTDSGVKVNANKSGEYMIMTTGEVHLEKCIEDMRERLSGIEFEISPPIYSLRETVDPNLEPQTFELKIDFSNDTNLTIEGTVFNLNQAVVDTLLEHLNLLKTIQDFEVPSGVDIWSRYKNDNLHKLEEKKFSNESVNKAIERLKSNLNSSFETSNYNWRPENVWCVSNVNRNINLLINLIPSYTCNIFTNPDENDARVLFYNYIITGFKKITNAGPLCEEPLMNCAFIIKEFKLNGNYETLPSGDAHQANTLTRSFHGFFRDVFVAQNPLIMEPMLSANIQTDAQGLGKLYSEVHKRLGKVVENLDLDENHHMFVVKAIVPAIESKGFANDIRKISSGNANPSLEFSHYQIISADLKLEQDSDDSDDEDDNTEVETRTQKLQKLIRRRKGLPVNEQIIIHAEKQRTLKK